MAVEPLPRDLTLPEPGSTTAREVLSRAIGRLLGELSAVHRLAPPGTERELAQLTRLVRAALAETPGALLSMLRRPTVGGLVRCLRHTALDRREAIFVELVAQLAFELAIARALPEPVPLRRWPARLLSIPALLSIALPAAALEVILANGTLTLRLKGGSLASISLDEPAPAGGAVVERPYHVIAGDLVLAEVDNNPLALLEAHPDKAGNAVDLGGRPAFEWTAALAAALARIERHLPDLHREVQLFVAQIVPVGWDPVQHLSASYQEIVGTVYLTLHPSQMTLSEALLHELSHNKLNAYLDLDNLLENAWSPLYTSPVRPDPRPLHGVLLAVHAFLPVARLYERMIASGDPEAQSEAFRARFAEIRKLNREGAKLLLAEGRPTTVGEGLFAEIRHWHAYYARFEETP